jgi:hypothetical protein
VRSLHRVEPVPGRPGVFSLLPELLRQHQPLLAARHVRHLRGRGLLTWHVLLSPSSSSVVFRKRAGLPATTVPSVTLPFTTDPTPTTQRAPVVVPGRCAVHANELVFTDLDVSEALPQEPGAPFVGYSGNLAHRSRTSRAVSMRRCRSSG